MKLWEEMFFSYIKEDIVPLQDIVLESPSKSPEEILIDREIGKELSKEAQMVIRVVLESPWELIQNMEMLTKHLRKMKVPYRLIWSSYKEIKRYLSET